jgi:hypothetical protein
VVDDEALPRQLCEGIQERGHADHRLSGHGAEAPGHSKPGPDPPVGDQDPGAAGHSRGTRPGEEPIYPPAPCWIKRGRPMPDWGWPIAVL